MEPQPNDVKAVRVLFFALLAGQLAFALIVTALVEAGFLASGNNEVTTILLVAVIVLAITAVPASYVFFKKRIAAINPEDELGKKLELYRAALILRMALCEMPALLSIIAYFVTHSHAFLWIIIVLIGNFLFIYPSGEKIINQLQLNSSEQSVLGLD
jgi:hypothetical protein